MMLCATVPGHADFKYTESSKMTGGAAMGAMKFAGVFSKQARDANGAQISTRAVKGNRLREENGDGTVQVIDLDGKRFIKIDPKAKTYTVLTFEQMKQQMLAAQQRMKAEQAKQTGDGKPKANLKLTPKIESSETGATRSLLGLNTKEMKIRIEMLMETDDPKAQGQQISSVMDTHSWIAPAVPGYDELKQFYIKMAKQMDWVPGTVMGIFCLYYGIARGLSDFLRVNDKTVIGLTGAQWMCVLLIPTGIWILTRVRRATAADAAAAVRPAAVCFLPVAANALRAVSAAVRAAPTSAEVSWCGRVPTGW